MQPQRLPQILLGTRRFAAGGAVTAQAAQGIAFARRIASLIVEGQQRRQPFEGLVVGTAEAVAIGQFPGHFDALGRREGRAEAVELHHRQALDLIPAAAGPRAVAALLGTAGQMGQDGELRQRFQGDLVAAAGENALQVGLGRGAVSQGEITLAEVDLKSAQPPLGIFLTQQLPIAEAEVNGAIDAAQATVDDHQPIKAAEAGAALGPFEGAAVEASGLDQVAALKASLGQSQNLRPAQHVRWLCLRRGYEQARQEKMPEIHGELLRRAASEASPRILCVSSGGSRPRLASDAQKNYLRGETL